MKKVIKIIIFIFAIIINIKVNYCHYFFDNNANWTGEYHEYNDNVEVITAVEIYAPNGFPRQNKRPHERKDDEAKNGAVNKTGECKVNFSGACGSQTQVGAIAKGETRLFWVKWRTPSLGEQQTEKTVTINVSVSSGGYFVINGDKTKTSAAITCKIYKPKIETPPDTNYDDLKEESDIETSAPVGRIPDQLEKTFHTYTYRWVEDWHYVCTRSGNDEKGYPEEYSQNYREEIRDITCSAHRCPAEAENHTCPTGDCNVQAQDWGEVVWEKWEHKVLLQITSQKLQLAENTPFPDGYPQDFDYDRIETIRSGYGIWYRFNCSSIYCFPGYPPAINYDYDDYFTHPQVCIFYYPEFDYDDYADRAYNTNDDINPDCFHYGDPCYHTMLFDTPYNPYSHFYNFVHYIPIYFPDGPYEVLAEVSSCFSPAGELTLTASQYMEIEGSIWDDLHIRQGN